MKFDEVRSALIEAANEAGLKEYEIYYMRDNGISAETLKDEISNFSYSLGGGVSFRCVCDGKMGYASSELLEENEMRELVKRAISNAENMDDGDGAEIFKGSESYATLEQSEIVLPDAASVKDTALALQRKTYSCSEFVTDGTQSAALASKLDIELINSHQLFSPHTLQPISKISVRISVFLSRVR